MLQLFKSSYEALRELPLSVPEKGAWLNLINPKIEELNAAAVITGAPLDFLRAALDEEERSRTEIEENCLLVITNIPVMRGVDSYDTLPLSIILTPDYIVTVCLENNRVLSDFCPTNAKYFSTFKRTRFLFQLLYKSATYYLTYLKQINKRTDEIERQLRKSMQNRELFQLMELQKGYTFFSASLRSNGIVLEKLLRLRLNNQLQHLIKVYEEDEDLLEDVIIENKQAIEMVEMYNHILNGMMDTFASVISNNLNMVMKFLASMTIILSIPTMVASFFGMNVPLPFGLEQSFGFGYILVLSVTGASVAAFALWRKDMF
ncbi:magnesium transporter CorA family protein [Acetonema longum]|uniref:Mg2 transporter protein CorA family protein n=1 Tax=Acetonema longum DSM 6540 TaxID=1009370 RepID=F7NIY2_9FIRM|nr:magnesium transporter CorA family protein [Acetonema longum]EGO63979.1 Mg2 transporter protein CorA family protein [Acetonema longum DSM 6540]